MKTTASLADAAAPCTCGGEVAESRSLFGVLLVSYVALAAVIYLSRGHLSESGLLLYASLLGLILLVLLMSYSLAWSLAPRVAVEALDSVWPHGTRCSFPPALLVVCTLLTLPPVALYLRPGAWSATPRMIALLCVPFALSYLGVPRRSAALRPYALPALATLGLVAKLAIVLGSPAPKIDVWFVLQEGADALGRGVNPYAVEFTNPYDPAHPLQQYAYWPVILLCTAPFRWMFGDVRYALIAAEALFAVGLYRLASPSSSASRERGDRTMAEVLALLWWNNPRSLFMLEQSWTEPLQAAMFVGLLLAIRAGYLRRAAGVASLFLMAKLYVWLVAPLLLVAVLQLSEARRKLAGLALPLLLGPAITAPFLLLDAHEFISDTVIYQLSAPINTFSLSFAALGLRWFDAHMPAWMSGLFAIGALGAGAIAYVRTKDMGSLEARLACGSAVTLLLALPFQKMAHPNYYYLALALLATAVSASPGGEDNQSRPLDP